MWGRGQFYYDSKVQFLFFTGIIILITSLLESEISIFCMCNFFQDRDQINLLLKCLLLGEGGDQQIKENLLINASAN